MKLPVRTVLISGLALGIAGDVLLRGRGGPGLNIFILFAALGVTVGMLGRRSGLAISREAGLFLALGVAFAATFVLRASEGLQAFAFLAAAVAFALPALRAGAAWLRGSGVSEQIEAVVGAAANGALGTFRLVGQMLSGEPDERNAGPAWAVVRGIVLAVPFLIVFGALFMAADRIFADLMRDVFWIDLEEMVSHVAVTLVLTWLACGYLTGFLTGTQPIGVPDVLRARPRIGIVEIGVALAMVDLLFALFVGVQFRYLFGGSALVEVTPGLTYAEYVREGFEHLALACALVLPSLLLADWVLRPGGRGEGGDGRGVFRVLGSVLLVLLAVIVASAFQRVSIYEEAYGLTESRFYGAAFLGWVTLLGAWFGATVLRCRRERFAFPALASGLTFVGLLTVANPDAWIARNNVARAAEAEVDAAYLASLSADAVPTLVAALPDLPPEPRCVLARGLLERWGPEAAVDPDWRSWNRPVARARDIVSRTAPVLRSLVEPRAENGCPPVEGGG